MRMTRTITTAVLAAALALGLPGAVGVASAHDNDNGNGNSTSSSATAFWATATPAQKAAVGAARQAYLTTAWGIGNDLKKQIADLRASTEATLNPLSLKLLLAGDALLFAKATGGDVAGTQAAYDAAKSAYKAAADKARTDAQPAIDKARSDAKTKLDAAKALYTSTVTGAFPQGTAIPQSVLTPPGTRGGSSHGRMGMMGSSRGSR